MKRMMIIAMLATGLIGCSDRTAALVNGESILESEVNKNLAGINPELLKRVGEEKMKRSILEGLVEQRLVLLRVRDEKFDMRADVLRRWAPMERDLTLRYFLNEFLPLRHPVPENALLADYGAKRESFRIDGEVRARHILVRTGEGGHSEAEAVRMIQEIAGQLKPDGSNFQDLAQKRSECPSATDGGDLGFFGRDRMVKPFEEAAYALSPGQFTRRPVRTVHGFHLIKVEERKEDEYAPFELVRSDLERERNLRQMAEAYGVLADDRGIGSASPETVVGSIGKTGFSYRAADFYRDLDEMIGVGTAARVRRAAPAEKKKAVHEMLMARVFEDRIEALAMRKDADYLSFVDRQRREFMAREYMERMVFGPVVLEAGDLRGMPKEGGEAAVAFREQALTEKKRRAYNRLIDEIKAKYSVIIN